MCQPAPGTGRVILIARSVETDPPGTAPSFEAYNLPAMTPYGGSVAALIDCPEDDMESDPLPGCAFGVPSTQWVVKRNGQPTGTVYYTSALGAVIAAPAGWAPGPCPSAMYAVTGGGAQVAGPSRASTAPFAGAADTWNTGQAGGLLHSFTVDAAGVTDGLPGQTSNQVLVDMPDGTSIALGNARVRTFSVQRDQDNELRRDYRVRATGNAHAIITYTFV